MAGGGGREHGDYFWDDIQGLSRWYLAAWFSVLFNDFGLKRLDAGVGGCSNGSFTANKLQELDHVFLLCAAQHSRDGCAARNVRGMSLTERLLLGIACGCMHL